MRKIVLIHGISTDGVSGIFRLSEVLDNQKTIYKFRYGPIDTNEARDLEFLQTTALRLIAEVGDDCDVIAHSNGCRVILEAMRLGMDAHRVILFAPAVESWMTLPGKDRGCEYMFVVHNPRDRAIAVGEMLLYHPFGAMGRDGYRGPRDDRIHNCEAPVLHTPGFYKHSGYFTGKDLPVWGERVNGWLKNWV